MIKKFMGVVLAGFLVGCLALVWGWRQWTGPGPVPSGFDPSAAPTVMVRIPPGMTLTAAADTLVVRGLLADARVLRLGARLTGQGKALRAGLYALHFGVSPHDLLVDLTLGRSVQIKVTIPEGLDSKEIADLVAAALTFEASAFLATADSMVATTALREGWLGPATSKAAYDSLLNQENAAGKRYFRWCEGYLAPDTYMFAEGTTATRAAEVLVAMQFERLRAALSGSDAGLAPHELLVLASIVEAEARREDERARIAAVYTNRLAQGWRLEADPTVAFILGKKGKRLFYKDLKVDSAFNTYRHRGLPPGPIGAPGWAALQAAARPDPDCEALYFVSDGANGHVFSRTAAEHEDAVRQYRARKAAERRQGH